MIFKTLNGDLTIFNKTLISTRDHLKALQTANATVYNNNGAFNLQGLLVNSSQSTITFTKLNNAFKAYNGNLSKSTQLQNAYIQAVGKQNVTLGNYLAGLNDAKASMGGYVKSLITAKMASIGLRAASIALNTAISMGITFAISGLISQISKWIHAQEEARQKTLELTNSYKEQRDSLASQIAKYKELKETLDNGNLSTDEARSTKEQLLEIQKSLIDSYGNEASNIDLVNGKYKEQLGLLNELSKEKATDYVAENRDVFEDAKEELEKIRTYTINGIVNWNTLTPKTEDQQALLDFIESYSELFDITADGSSNYASGRFDVRNLVIKADVENADEIMRRFYDDLDRFGKDNSIDVSGILEGISGQLKKTTSDEFKEYRTIYDEFMKAEIVRNDTLRPLYQKSIQAVEDYNEALSSGEGIAEAKANLDTVQQSAQNATGELEGSQEVFDSIYDGINKSAESAYNLAQSFENNESVKEFAEQLRGLTDIDLQAINFKDNVQSPGEEAFRALINILGLSEDEVQNLIDKLVELGYVQGEIQNSTTPNLSFNIDTYKDQIDDIQSSISTLRSALDSFNSGTLDTSAVIDLMQQFPALVPYVDLAADGFGNLSEGLSTLIAQQPDSLIQSLETLKDSLNTDEERAQVDALINSLQALSSYGDTGMEAYATSIGSTWTDTANVIESVTTQFENLAKVQEAVANGLSMSTTAAAELAKMYPEILTNAEYAGNGQITLNEEVVKSILAGDQAIINAQITKLEADKAELEARKETAIAELEIANQVGTAKGQIDEETARNKIALLNQELENEISQNNQVGQSYAKTAEGMALNTEQLGNYEADVADNMATNMNTASSSMADGMATNSEASQISLSGIAQKATDVALAIAGIPTGNTIKNPSAIYAGRGGTNKGGIKKVASPGRFTSTVNDFVKGELSLDEFKSNIEVDISSYEKAISNIDSQIDVLKNLQATFNDTVNSANGGIGGHNYANKIKDLEKEKDKINNALKDKKDSSKKEKDEYKEVFDFFDHRIKVLDNALSILKANLDNVTGSFAKNNLIDAELGITEEKFKNYSDALNMYTQKANDALSKLPADIAAKVKDGAVDLTTFVGDGNKEVVEAIKDYEQWADKVSDCKQELAELRTAIRQLELEKFNNIMEDFTSQFDLHEDGKELISKQVDLLKEAGQLIGESFFTTQIDQSKKQLALLEDEKIQLVNQMSSAIGSGRVD